MADEIIRNLSVDGLRYGYRVLRQPSPRTEPVIILGGALQGMYGWPQMDDHLGPLASVVTADLPGMGDADLLPPGAGDDVLHAAVTGIIDDLNVERANLFGFSYGTSIAFGCAQQHPGRIARLMLGGVPAHITDEQRDRWGRAVDRLETGDLEGLAGLAAGVLMCQDPERKVHRGELARRYVRRSFLYALTSTPHAALSLHRALGHRPDFSGGLSGVPALVFAGEHDTVTSPERQRAFAATIEGSRFVTVGESDHWVVLERPDDVADLAARFFTDRPLEPAPALGPVRTTHPAALPGQSRTSPAPAGRDFADTP
ncbi:alpha/beta hydrolase [Streptomyces sp. NPDC005989]|uniref:alpha/beta fold hydrolase n=1 Tax=Streptomyces sp. NPDC005989 TaxID=3156727 RepID=UPI0033EDCF06